MSNILNLHFGQILNAGIGVESESSVLQVGLDAQVDKLLGLQIAGKGDIGRMNGIQVALKGDIDNGYFFQTGVMTDSSNFTGLKLSLYDQTRDNNSCYYTSGVTGVKLALVNDDRVHEVIGLRIGGVNYNTYKRMNFTGIGAVYDPKVEGLDLAILSSIIKESKFYGASLAGIYSQIDNLNGFSFAPVSMIKNGKGVVASALFSRIENSFEGLQIAPVCVGPSKGNYVQIGALTLRKRADNNGYDASPVVGWHFDK